jgi:hypothetical protein
VNAQQISRNCCLAALTIVSVTVPNTCPYTLSIAQTDYQYIINTTGSTVQCYVDYFWSYQVAYSNWLKSNITVGVKQRCCYYNSNGRLATKLPDAGLAIADQPEEANFFASCLAGYAVIYRPISTSANYAQVALTGSGLAWGTAHYYTFDGLAYTFIYLVDPVQEQITVRSIAGQTPNFTVQCRAVAYTAVNGVQVTMHKACAMQCGGGPVFQLDGLNSFPNPQNFQTYM